jgi:DUF971 family protein
MIAPTWVALAPEALTLRWDDGDARIAADVLRAHCRCAECTARVRLGEPLRAADGLHLVEARPLGHYALQLVFSDGHERGLYPWTYLREIGARLHQGSGPRA